VRKFEETEAITLVEKTLAEETVAACETYLPPLDDFESHKGWLVEGVRAKIFNTCEICRDGVPIAYLFFQVGPLKDKTLIVTAVHSIVKENVALFIELATIRLAKQKECGAIEFVTRRPEMARQSAILGYKAIGVVMRLKI
jgi:hypothetical protein